MNSFLPYLSVIIPIYNVEKYLNQCIESIISQTYKNLEIILIDDGATGNEPQICDYYAQKYDNIHVVHKKNAGLVEARKTGISLASSEYITFLDGDDYIAPDFYEKAMTHVINEQPDLVAVSFTELLDGRETKCCQHISDGTYSGAALSKFKENMNCMECQFYDFGIFPSTCLKIYRTELLKKTSPKVPSSLRIGEDSAFTYPYVFNCSKIVVDNTISGYYYRIVPSSMAHTIDERYFINASELFKYLEPIYARTESDKIYTQLNYYRAYIQYSALNKWAVGKSLFQIIRQTDRLRELIEKSTLFDNAHPLLKLTLPKEFRKKLGLITNKKWFSFKFLCVKNKLSSSIKSTVKKILKRS